MSNQDKFWIVWNPANPRSPTVRHPNKPAAVEEALRLANRPENLGQKFFVMGEEGVASAPKPTAIWQESIEVKLTAPGFDAPFKATATLTTTAKEPAPWLPAGDGWIEHSGGNKNPVPGARIEWLTRGERAARDYTRAVINSDDFDDWSVVAAYRVVEPAKKRELKHGEYQKGDRVRYVARQPGWEDSKHIGRIGTVSDEARGMSVPVEWEGESPKPSLAVYPANIEHESLPQFRKGDRVRIGPKGLVSVKEAAGKDAKVTGLLGDNIQVSLFHEVRTDYGRLGRTFVAEPQSLTLLIPAREGV